MNQDGVGRQAVRYLAVLIGGVFAGECAVAAIRAWQEWHRWTAQDPSGADAYRTFFLLNSAAALVSVGLAALLWHLLRPKTQEFGPDGRVGR